MPYYLKVFFQKCDARTCLSISEEKHETPCLNDIPTKPQYDTERSTFGREVHCFADHHGIPWRHDAGH